MPANSYSRRSTRHSGGGADPSSTSGHSRRRVRDDEEEEEKEEEAERVSSNKRRKHQPSDDGDSRRRRREPSEEVEEEEMNEEEDDGEAVVVDDDDDEEEDRNGGKDEGLWGLNAKQLNKIKVTQAARNAMEAMGKEDVKRKANDLARLALFCEHNRITLKREEIRKKILDDKATSKAFPLIFNRAQKVLAFTFGYEMVELRARGTDNVQITNATQHGNSEDAGKEGEDGQKQGGTKSGTYILRSLLPSKIIAKMAVPNTGLSVAINDVSEAVDGEAFDSEGVMVDWKRSRSELGSMGLLFFILSLILLNGRSLPEDLLRSYLRRMSLDPHKTLPAALQPDMNRESMETGLTLDDYLRLLIKQSYLECTKVGAGGQGAMSMDASLGTKRVQARGRKSKGGEESGNSLEEQEWRWGARAEAEITEKAVANFVSDIYFDAEDEEGDSSIKKKQERFIEHIQLAAGSELISA